MFLPKARFSFITGILPCSSTKKNNHGSEAPEEKTAISIWEEKYPAIGTALQVIDKFEQL